MALRYLSVQFLRNITTLELYFEQFNVLYGHNGSGKTSILEAIYLLATGRSFRAHHQHVIQRDAPCLYVRGEVSWRGLETKIALQKSRQDDHIIKIGPEVVKSMAEVAQYLPVQALHLMNYQLLQDAPEARRKLLDWGVFHVEHSFLNQWRSFNQLLKQRNAALRQQNHPQSAWDQPLAEVGEAIHALRATVCASWLPMAVQMIEEFLALTDISIDYRPGWDTHLGLKEVLSQHMDKDVSLGYTYYGPQRADLQVKYQGKLAQHILSQGQQKRLVAALQLAQASWVYEQINAPGVLLIDDLPAELDAMAREQIMSILKRLNRQVFVTCVDESLAKQMANLLGGKLFHVKHGTIVE